MQRYKQPYGAATYPLSDAIPRTSFHSGYQSGVINDAVEDLAGGWFGITHAVLVHLGPQGDGVVSHPHRDTSLSLCVRC